MRVYVVHMFQHVILLHGKTERPHQNLQFVQINGALLVCVEKFKCFSKFLPLVFCQGWRLSRTTPKRQWWGIRLTIRRKLRVCVLVVPSLLSLPAFATTDSGRAREQLKRVGRWKELWERRREKFQPKNHEKGRYATFNPVTIHCAQQRTVWSTAVPTVWTRVLRENARTSTFIHRFLAVGFL